MSIKRNVWGTILLKLIFGCNSKVNFEKQHQYEVHTDGDKIIVHVNVLFFDFLNVNKKIIYIL